MAKSFCTGCKYWEWYDASREEGNERFRYCAKYDTEDLESRKIQCGGKYNTSNKKEV